VRLCEKCRVTALTAFRVQLYKKQTMRYGLYVTDSTKWTNIQNIKMVVFYCSSHYSNADSSL